MNRCSLTLAEEMPEPLVRFHRALWLGYNFVPSGKRTATVECL